MFYFNLTFPRLSLVQWRIPSILASLTTACWIGLAAPGTAVESVTAKAGPFSQTVQLEDLKEFAQTGAVRPSLKTYKPLLTSQVQQSLNSRFAIDSTLGRRLLEEFLASPGGEQLLDTVQSLLPNLAEAELITAFEKAAADPEGLSILGVLSEIPGETLTMDMPKLLSLVSQLNLSRLEGEALSRVLEEELRVSEEMPPLTSNPSQSGTARVVRWHLNLQDTERDRTVPVDLYWSDQTQGPLVVMSHGFGADRHFLAYLAKHLASYGLTVASIEHSGSNVAALTSLLFEDAEQAGLNRILPASEFVDRPKDITFVLNRLDRLNRDSYSLRGRLNTKNVMFIGHSLGGYTGLALAGARLDLKNLEQFCQPSLAIQLSPADWLQCAALDLPERRSPLLRDRRIQRLLIMNPLTGQLFGDKGLKSVRIPTLMLTSTRDSVTPIARQQLIPFTQLSGSKTLVVAIGGSHLSVGDPENLNPELSQVPFMPEVPDSTTEKLRLYLRGLSLSYALQAAQGGNHYRFFLTPAYAQRFSQDTLTLRLSHNLPKSISGWLRTAQHTGSQRNQPQDYLPSLIHLEAISFNRRFRALQQQIFAYLKTSPPSMTAVYLPHNLFQSSLLYLADQNLEKSAPKSVSE